MTTEIFLNNIAFIFGFTIGDYLLFFMSIVFLVFVFISLFYRLTRD